MDTLRKTDSGPSSNLQAMTVQVSPHSDTNKVVHSDAASKANILAEHFSSIYTHEQPGPLPNKGPSPYSSMPDIIISATGIEHILSNLKPQKAAGPDTIPATVLKESSHQIPPILEIIFNKSLQTGQVPNDRKEANVAPIFKKGDKHNPCNYRPISLTCIISKCMEHILVSNIMQHLDSNKILYALQHGFRKNFSPSFPLPGPVQQPLTN